MSPVDYSVMSDAELKQYFLAHRDNPAALRAYLNRINQRPLRVLAKADDPAFDQKVQAAIRQKLMTEKRPSQ